jgi:hypothetical protein
LSSLVVVASESNPNATPRGEPSRGVSRPTGVASDHPIEPAIEPAIG